MSDDESESAASPPHQRRATVDPWGHEPGEDTGHRLDSQGHWPAQHDDRQARIISVEPVVEKKRWFRFRRRD